MKRNSHVSVTHTTLFSADLYYMGSVLDLHCHTVHGSPDSELSAAQLVEKARQTGLTACCITEHDKMWDKHHTETLSREFNVSFIRGMEVTTNLGHMIVYGLDHYVSGIHDAHALSRTVHARGGLMIVAHPFRKLLLQLRYNANSPKAVIPTFEEACDFEVFKLVDEVEVLNGGTSDLENYFALRVARRLGFHGVSGSDAHSLHGVGRFTTVFYRDVTTVPELVTEVKAGRYYPAQAERHGDERVEKPYSPGTVDPEIEERLKAAIAALA